MTLWRGAGFLAGSEAKEGPTLEPSVLEGLCPMGRAHNEAVCGELWSRRMIHIGKVCEGAAGARNEREEEAAAETELSLSYSSDNWQ